VSTKAAQKLLSLWLSVGEEAKGGKARHPEFIYRKTGEWISWNDFLNVSKNDKSFKSNCQQDEIDNQAWKLYQVRVDFINKGS
jgi:hypothetical protein